MKQIRTTPTPVLLAATIFLLATSLVLVLLSSSMREATLVVISAFPSSSSASELGDADEILEDHLDKLLPPPSRGGAHPDLTISTTTTTQTNSTANKLPPAFSPFGLGEWVLDEDEMCNPYLRGKTRAPSILDYVCTPKGYYWKGAGWRYVETKAACAVFKNRGITHVLVSGDSFSRHLAVALALTLRGNYVDGGLQRKHDPECANEGQFSEAKCRLQLDFHQRGLCGGTLSLDLDHGYNTHLHLGEDAPSSVVLWTSGNHPADKDYVTRKQILDVHARIPLWQHDCRTALRNPKHVFWLPPHQNLKSLRPDGEEDRVRRPKYAMESVAALWDICRIRTIDVYSFTAKLVEIADLVGAYNMTYDTYHWSRTVNLIKAQIVLAELMRQLPVVRERG